MLGIGLGAFVDGFARGYGLRAEAEEREERRLDRQEDREWRAQQRDWAEEDRAWKAEDRAFQTAERQRALDQREAIENINAEGRAAFDEQVAAGAFKPEEFDDFWKRYTLPKMTNQLLLNGDMDGAKKLMEWADSEDAKKGGQLFAGALFKAQTGDHGGALDDVIEAGKLRGYIAGDFDIDEKEPILDGDGTLVGYRVTIRNGDEEIQQDIALDDITTVVATFANPEAAWESQQAAAADRRKRDEDLKDYEAEKEIDQRYSGDDNEDRKEAIEALRERMKPDPLDPDGGGVAFDDLSRDEQEELIQSEIDLMKGTSRPSPPAPGMIVDTESGQPYAPPGLATGQPQPRPQPPAPTPAALSSAPGLGGIPRPAEPAGRVGASVGAAAGGSQLPTPQNAVARESLDPPPPPPPSNARLVDQAARLMVEGGNPQEIARSLAASGIDQSQWPPELVRVLNSRPANGPR